jgi:hypothetical protein
LSYETPCKAGYVGFAVCVKQHEQNINKTDSNYFAKQRRAQIRNCSTFSSVFSGLIMKTCFSSFPAFYFFAIIGFLWRVPNAVSQPAPVQLNNISSPTLYAVTGRDANSRVWERTVYEIDPSGEVVTNKHNYTELASGMHYKNAKGEWVESKEEIDAYAKGAIANQGRYQVIFANNLNTTGSIDMQTPDGKRLRSNILGLGYYDSLTDQSLLIAQIQDSQGELISTNQVLYPNAFSGVKADVRYTYKRGSFEQDVILREQPPTPESLGLNPQTTEIEVMTEFVNPPEATIKEIKDKYDGESDQNVSWGAMSIGHGKAFDLGEKQKYRAGVRVIRQYVTSHGRKILLEKVPVPNIVASLSKLPSQASIKSKLLRTVSREPQFPKTPFAQTEQKPIQLAIKPQSAKGYVLDYVETTSQTDFTFQGDITYLVTGELYLDGTTTIEGGTVIKFINDNVGLTLTTPACKTSSYHPAIFTSSDDNSVGETISGSSGNPVVSGDGDPWLYLVGGWSLNNIRFCYANTAIMLAAGPDGGQVSDGQFIHCGQALQGEDYFSGDLTLRNVLFSDCNYAIYGSCGSGMQVVAEQVTGDVLYFIAECDNPVSLFLTNSIIKGTISISGGLYTNHVALNPSGTIFQAAGAGNYYLTNGSPYRNTGTTNISPTTLADIASKTTYSPIVYTIPEVYFHSNLVLYPQAQRDTDTPDLGYHYDPIDYVFGPVYTTNSTITVNPGTAIALYGTNSYTYGFAISDNSQFVSHGAAGNLNHIIEFNTVQEQTPAGWKTPYYGLITRFSGLNVLIDCSFTDWSSMARDVYHFRVVGSGPFNFQNCQFHGGMVNTTYPTLNFTNCLFERVNTYMDMEDNLIAVLRNNLVFGGTFEYYSANTNMLLRDNLFDRAIIPDDIGGFGGTYYGGNNAYVTNCDRLHPTFASDVILTSSLNYQTGPLGNYYQPTNSPLINMGSTTADQVGLYHFTTLTNQLKETNSIVDIGYHHVATDAFGDPIDSNGDAVSDYVEDANGNGLNDLGETCWSLAITAQPTNQTQVQGGSAVFTVIVVGVAQLSYQWFFNNTNVVAGATNAILTINNAQTNNAGSYFVMITNNGGAINSSNAVLTLLVPPTISITNPATSSAFMAGSNISVSATAVGINSTITQVQFFQGTNSLGIGTNAPYGLIWSNAPAGIYMLSAVATANNGLTATSSIINVFVSPLLSSTNLAIWLKADAITGLTNAAGIATWLDASGRGENATQSNAGNRPLWITNALNGQPVVRFNGTNSFFTLPNFLSGTTQGEEFVVLKVGTNLPSGQKTLWRLGSGEPPVDYPNTGGQITEGFGSTIVHNLGVPASPLTEYHLYEVAGQSGSWMAWINGQLQASLSANTYGFWNDVQALGYDTWYTDYYFYGDVAEVLIFNRTLTSDERVTINNYLNGKYGLVPSVPSAPTNLMAQAVSTTQIGLTWNQNFNHGATRVSLERKTGGGGTYQEIVQLTDATSYLDTNLTVGTTYYYRARAVNLIGWSDYCNETNATTLTTGADFPLSSLLLWLKADTGLEQAGTNTPVNFWADQSGMLNNATETNQINRPSWVANALNGQPVVRFNGSNSFFKLPNFLSGTTQGEEFVVLKVGTNLPSSQKTLWRLGSGEPPVDYPNTSGQITEGFGSTVVRNLGVPASPLTQYHLYEVAGQSGSWMAWINSQLQTNLTSNTYGFWDDVQSLGYDTWNTDYYFYGDVAEILIFNRTLTTDERVTVNNYLNGKFGMVAVVSITTPTNNSIFATGSNIALTASAFESAGGTIKRVEYFQETNSLGFNTTAPYSVTWNNVAAGSMTTNNYALTARVTGDNGLMSTSSVVNIQVNPAPSVLITSPSNNAYLGIAPVNLTISATASDLTGIKMIQFFQGTNSLGVVTNAPYNLAWNSVPAANYSLTAVATGNDTLTNTSAAVNIIVDIDSDSDGLGDLQEQLFGTNPNVSDGFWIWISAPNGTF